jgi:hypothetical protein
VIQSLLGRLDGRVHTANGLLNINSLDGEGDAVLVTAGVVDAVVDPDRPRGLLEVLAVRAGDEVGAAVGEEAIFVDLPAVALAVPGHRLSTSGVTELALAHTREIDVGLLARVADRVEPELIANEVEGNIIVLLLVVAGGTLILKLQSERLLGSLDGAEVDGSGGAEDKTIEVGVLGSAGLGGGRDDASGDERSEEKSLNLHIGGCCWLVLKVVEC